MPGSGLYHKGTKDNAHVGSGLVFGYRPSLMLSILSAIDVKGSTTKSLTS